MTNKIIRVLGALLLTLMFTYTSFGCSPVVGSVTEFDDSEYVFTGTVVDYVGPVKPRYVTGDAWGLIVKMETSVHLPKTPVSHFEVFPYQLEADCSMSGTLREELRKSYPVGSKVMVIAREPKFDGLEDGNVKLVISPTKNGLLSVTKDVYASGANSSEYDYRTYQETESALPVFELRKDLLRLREARSEEEKVMILKRLVYYPRRFLIDFAGIAKSHLKDKSIINQLIEEREAWTERPANRSTGRLFLLTPLLLSSSHLIDKCSTRGSDWV